MRGNNVPLGFVGVDTVFMGHHNQPQSAATDMGSDGQRDMQNEDSFREVAAKACSEALQEKAGELAASIAQKLGTAFGAGSAAPNRTKELLDGTVLIAGSRTQTETLESLLAASSAITPDCGLLILRGAQASGWSCHGLTSIDNFKRAIMDCSRGEAAAAVRSAKAVAVQASELDSIFIARLGLGNSTQLLLVPVLLKERVAALLIAVSKQSDDLAGLELLVHVAQMALDLQVYRKTAPQPATHPSAVAQPHAAAEVEANRGATAPSGVHRAVPDAVYASTAAGHAAASALHSGTAQGSTVQQPMSPALDEAHERARRFAKLLVEEIKLYNQTKVSEGRARGDLYSRLRDDIEKSRTAYQKRYGESVRDVDYFTQELMRILADNNRAVMGAGFPG